jgi:hypothetical protein
MSDKFEALQLEAETLSGLMMQLAENEIDSDSFAVMSDLGENGTEHECDLPITETALRASAVIDQLLAALEEKDQAHRLHAARLIDERGQLRKRAEAAEQRLQQPIKLPNTTTNRHEWTTWQWIEHVGGRYQHGDPGDYIEFGSVMAVGAMLQQFQRTVIAVALVEIKNSLRLQGFKVEGE